jgi:hypothetical protein
VNESESNDEVPEPDSEGSDSNDQVDTQDRIEHPHACRKRDLWDNTLEGRDTLSLSVTSLMEASIPIVNAAYHGTTAGNTMIRFPPMIYPKE